MADKTFPGQTYKQFTPQDVETITVRFSRGEPGQPAKGEPLLVGGRAFLYDGAGKFVRMVGANKDATTLSAAKKTAFKNFRDDFVTWLNAKLSTATKPEEV